MTNKAQGDAGVGEIDGSGITKAPDVSRATQGHSSNQPSQETRGSQATVLAPSPAESKLARSDHQNALLNLLKGPVTPGAVPTSSTLGAPNPTFELSAVPSPGHSRDTSGVAPPPNLGPVRDGGPILPMSQPTTKRAKAKLAPRKSPVSATVDGPLNVPQFDMLSQKSAPGAKVAEDNGKVEAPRKSPVTILARPQKGQSNLLAENQTGFAAAEKAVTMPTPTPQAAKPMRVLQKTPATVPPGASTTILPPSSAGVSTSSATIAPLDTIMALKQSAQMPQQPQDPARRPLHIRPQTQPDSILSPISPLPSPKHSLPFDRRGQQSSEQKKSLLSLFNNPAPASAAATGSPVASTSKATAPPPPFTTGSPSTLTSQTAMAPPARVQSALISPPAVQSFEQRISGGPAPAPGSLSKRPTGEVEAAEGRSSGRQTPQNTKSFLLGYLDSVVMGGK